MVRLTLLALALGLAFPGAAAAQAELDFKPLRAWDEAEPGTKSRGQKDLLALRSGTIQSGLAYQDFVLRFDYRVPAAGSGGALFLRSRFEEDFGARGYAVALDNGTGRGQAHGAQRSFHEVRFEAAAAAITPGQWVAGEVRVEGDRLTVSLDGVVVSVGDRLDDRAGFVAFRTTQKDGLELRNIRLAVLTLANTGSTVAAAAGAGMTPPALVYKVPPQYPASAMNAKAAGLVLLEIVIDTAGTASRIRVLHAPHPDLAIAAITCVQAWRFNPGARDGVAIPVKATVEVAFKLK